MWFLFFWCFAPRLQEESENSNRTQVIRFQGEHAKNYRTKWKEDEKKRFAKIPVALNDEIFIQTMRAMQVAHRFSWRITLKTIIFI